MAIHSGLWVRLNWYSNSDIAINRKFWFPRRMRLGFAKERKFGKKKKSVTQRLLHNPTGTVILVIKKLIDN